MNEMWSAASAVPVAMQQGPDHLAQSDGGSKVDSDHRDRDRVHRYFDNYRSKLERLEQVTWKNRAIELLLGLLANILPGRMQRQKQHRVLRRSPLFDAEWYLEQYPDVASRGMDAASHYLAEGFREGRRPGPFFNGVAYHMANPDVAEAGVNPLLHFEMHGKAEGRKGGLEFHADLAAAAFSSPNQASIHSCRTPSILWVYEEPETAGYQYRVTRFMESARSAGFNVDSLDVRDWEKGTSLAACADVVIIWRTSWSPELSCITSIARRRGGRIVFDVDDLMFDPDLCRIEIIDGIRSQGYDVTAASRHFAAVRLAMLEADACFATTEELACHMRRAGQIALVLPNGFSSDVYIASLAAVAEQRACRDGLIRIGYAGGSRTHQRDFARAVVGLAAVLNRFSQCRLVLFKAADGVTPLVDVEEVPILASVAGQIEWRSFRDLQSFPREMARFDINIAPLEAGNPFCESKSELKFFEAALVNVPTVASPTGPFRRIISHGVSGFLAVSPQDWECHLVRLIEDGSFRQQVGREAHLVALQKFGPLQRNASFEMAIEQVHGGSRAARSFAFAAALSKSKVAVPKILPAKTVFESRGGSVAKVSVVISLFNYAEYVVEALESSAAQSLRPLDLVVVDDRSTDNSLTIVEEWAAKNRERFNRVLILANEENHGLASARNIGIEAAQSPYVMILDADNRLRPNCCERLLAALAGSPFAYAYPTIQQFGESSGQLSASAYQPQRLSGGNYIDAMALLSKEAWAIAGGYSKPLYGWEDYDLWCKIAECGLQGHWVDEVLADYRVHAASMLTTVTNARENQLRRLSEFGARHPWTNLIEGHGLRPAMDEGGN